MKGGNLNAYHLQCWTREKHCRKHELGFGWSNKEIEREWQIFTEDKVQREIALENCTIDRVEHRFQIKTVSEREWCLYSHICRGMDIWSMPLWSGRKPTWLSQVHIFQTIVSRRRVMGAICLDLILTNLILEISIWGPIKFLAYRFNRRFTPVLGTMLHCPDWSHQFC